MPRAPFSPLSFLALAAALTFPAAAQSPTPTPEVAYVTHKDFRTKLFVLQHRDAREVARSLATLGSGAKGAELTPNRDLGTLSVRDYPENIAAIEEALKRLDVPAAHGQSVEFHVHVLFASNSPINEGEYPEELQEVIAALRSTLAYRTYNKAVSLVLRGVEGTRGVNARGTTEVQGVVPEPKGVWRSMTLPFLIQIDNFKVETPANGPALIRLDKMTFESYAVSPEFQTKIQSDITLKAGEKVVVGTSTLKDKGVVVVLTAQLVK